MSNYSDSTSSSPSRGGNRYGSSQMQDRISHTAAVAYSGDSSSLDRSAESMFSQSLNSSPAAQTSFSNYASSTDDFGLEPPSDDIPKLPLSAKGMLIVYTCINLLSYFDRGSLSGMLEDITKSFPGTSATLKGLLGFAFMGGFMIASPVFAHAVSHYEPFRVMALGLFIWVCATILCSIAPSYELLLLGRILTGFGEASFLCIAPPFIDKFSPPASRGLWLSVFYAAIPVGYALGFIVSGVWLDLAPMKASSWRAIFMFESAMMIPFVIFSLRGKSPYTFSESAPTSTSTTTNVNDETGSLLAGDRANSDEYILHSDVNGKNSTTTFMHSMRVILFNPIYIFVVLGYAFQTFVTGGFAFFGIDYAKKALGMSKTDAGIYFGLVTIITGIFGTLSGGIISDKLRRRRSIPSACGYEGEEGFVATLSVALCAEQGMTTEQSIAEVEAQIETRKNDLSHPTNIRDRMESIIVSMTVVTLMTFIAIPLSLLAFAFDSSVAFFIFLTLAELLLFCCFSPLNNSVMWCVPFKYAPQAMAMSVVIVHLLGDSSSPLLIGAALDATKDNWHAVMQGASCVLVLAVTAWYIAYLSATRLAKPVRSYGFTSIFSAPDYSSWVGTEPVATMDPSGKLNGEGLPDEFVRIRKVLRWSLDSCVVSQSAVDTVHVNPDAPHTY